MTNITDLYKPPFHWRGGYIWDADGRLVLGSSSEHSGPHIAAILSAHWNESPPTDCCPCPKGVCNGIRDDHRCKMSGEAQTWRSHDNDGMRYPEAADLSGGATDCPQPTYVDSRKLAEAWLEMSAFVGTYVDEYEFRDEGDYIPNEHERMLIEDAIHGLLAEEKFIPLIRNAIRASRLK